MVVQPAPWRKEDREVVARPVGSLLVITAHTEARVLAEAVPGGGHHTDHDGLPARPGYLFHMLVAYPGGTPSTVSEPLADRGNACVPPAEGGPDQAVSRALPRRGAGRESGTSERPASRHSRRAAARPRRRDPSRSSGCRAG